MRRTEYLKLYLKAMDSRAYIYYLVGKQEKAVAEYEKILSFYRGKYKDKLKLEDQAMTVVFLHTCAYQCNR